MEKDTCSACGCELKGNDMGYAFCLKCEKEIDLGEDTYTDFEYTSEDDLVSSGPGFDESRDEVDIWHTCPACNNSTSKLYCGCCWETTSPEDQEEFIETNIRQSEEYQAEYNNQIIEEQEMPTLEEVHAQWNAMVECPDNCGVCRTCTINIPEDERY